MLNLAYAMGTQPAGKNEPPGFLTFLPLIIIFAIFYFLLIRPQQKKQREHQTMTENLKKGDKVITTGGIYGTVKKIKENSIILQIADQVSIEVSKNAVGTVLK